MARYLSTEWFDLVAAHSVRPPGVPLAVLRQVVQDGPDGDVTYVVAVSDGGATIEHEGPHAEVDVTFTVDWPTSVALARGRLSARAALHAGRLRVSRTSPRLSTLGGRLAGLDPVPAAVRAATTWGDVADEADPDAHRAGAGTTGSAGEAGPDAHRAGAGTTGSAGVEQ